MSLATQKPHSPGLPFELWTLERLQREFEEREGVHLSDSTIWTWLRDEGLQWKRQQSWFHDAARHDPEFVEKKGAIIRAYTAPPAGCRVICVDELGPLSAKTYPGEAYVPGAQRATVEPDYGRRGTRWVHGALEPATGEATVIDTKRRDSASHLQLLEQMTARFPAEQWLVIEDNLSTHASRDVQLALLSWPEMQVQFRPKYASWMNLIEPWWKQLKSLVLKGRRFEIEQALSYWNDHRRPYRWRTVPDVLPTPPLGGFGSQMIPFTA